MQSRTGSMIEAVANVAVGYVIAVSANIVVLPMFGFHPSFAQNAQITTAVRAIVTRVQFPAVTWRILGDAWATT